LKEQYVSRPQHVLMVIKTCRYPESIRLDLSTVGYKTIAKKRLRRASPAKISRSESQTGF